MRARGRLVLIASNFRVVRRRVPSRWGGGHDYQIPPLSASAPQNVRSKVPSSSDSGPGPARPALLLRPPFSWHSFVVVGEVAELEEQFFGRYGPDRELADRLITNYNSRRALRKDH